MLAVGVQHLARIAALRERARVQPPDLIADRLQKVELVRDQEHGRSSAAQTIDSGKCAGADQGIVRGERVFDQQEIDRRELQRV